MGEESGACVSLSVPSLNHNSCAFGSGHCLRVLQGCRQQSYLRLSWFLCSGRARCVSSTGVCLSWVLQLDLAVLEEQVPMFSHSHFFPFSKLGMQFRSLPTLPLLLQTSKPIKIARKGFHFISTTHFSVIQQEQPVPCCLASPKFPKCLSHLLQHFLAKQVGCLENSCSFFTFAHLSVEELIKVFPLSFCRWIPHN